MFCRCLVCWTHQLEDEKSAKLPRHYLRLIFDIIQFRFDNKERKRSNDNPPDVRKQVILGVNFKPIFHVDTPKFV